MNATRMQRDGGAGVLEMARSLSADDRCDIAGALGRAQGDRRTALGGTLAESAAPIATPGAPAA